MIATGIVLSTFFVFAAIMLVNWHAFFYFRDRVEYIETHTTGPGRFLFQMKFSSLLRRIRRERKRLKNTAV